MIYKVLKAFMPLVFLMLPAKESFGKQSDMLVIGDSIFHLTQEVPKQLAAGGLTFTMRAKSFATITEIYYQYVAYKEEFGVPRVVLMNGGGNDILLGAKSDCMVDNQRCKDVVRKTLDKGYELIELMAEDGVERVVFLGVHFFAKGNKPLNPVVDRAMSEVEGMMDSFPLDIAFADTRPLFRGRDDLLLFDDLHPNKKGSTLIANLILDYFSD